MTNQTSIRPWLRRFAETMEQQLRANDWKGDFQEMDFGDLLHRIDEELDELKDALNSGAAAEDVVKEAADVGNFLAALARLAWESDPPEEETWEDEMKRRAKDPHNIFQRFQDRQREVMAKAMEAESIRLK